MDHGPFGDHVPCTRPSSKLNVRSDRAAGGCGGSSTSAASDASLFLAQAAASAVTSMRATGEQRCGDVAGGARGESLR